MHSAFLFRLVLLAMLTMASLCTAQPVWWSRHGVLGGQADDYAVANVGQLKTLATAATFEMDLRLPDGAGTLIHTTVDAWSQPAGPGVVRDDYAALNQGQLKALAELFYTELNLPLPWSAAGLPPADDYALANLGQLKYVFSFNILTPGVTDTDADGLSDAWETAQFGNLGATPTANADTDALSNRAESLIGSNPTSSADESSTAAAALALVVYSP